MLFTKSLIWLGLAVSTAVAVPVEDLNSFSGQQRESGDAFKSLAQSAYDKAISQASKSLQSRTAGACTPSKIKVRREWRTLSVADRKKYIAAVKCVQASPSVYPPGVVPGALNLFDDFIAVHLNQTPFIHLTGTFLSWHRYFIHHYETRLAACGYSKPLPYWDWSLDAATGKPMSASPVFDGSDTSVGSDGTPIPHEGYQLPAPFSPPEMVTYLPPGSGGGCIAKGPFKGLQTRLGPVAMPIYGSTNFTGVPDPLNSNPRCVKRDLNTYSAKRFCSYANVTSLILGSPNVEIFQAVLQADPRYVTTPGEIGAHGGGHYIIGGDPGSDPFISPGDPAFYLHHANVDRVWWIWQLLDFPNRQTVAGTFTFMDFPPSPNVTVNDTVDLLPLAPPVRIGNLLNTLAGDPLCYVYL